MISSGNAVPILCPVKQRIFKNISLFANRVVENVEGLKKSVKIP